MRIVEFELDQGNKVLQLALGPQASVAWSRSVFQFGFMLTNGWLFTWHLL